MATIVRKNEGTTSTSTSTSVTSENTKPSSTLVNEHKYWRTPLHHIELGSTNPEVQVPVSALYGFIFGRKKHAEHFESILKKDDHEQKKDESSAEQHCGCTYLASFVVTALDGSTCDESITLPLASPTAKQKVLTSTRVAKGFYLPKGTNVSIACVASCDENNTACEWVWGLILQKQVYQQVQDCAPPQKKSKNDDCKLDAFDSQKIYFNPIQSKKKPLLCTKCVRQFSNSQDTRNHWISGHAPKLDDISEGEGDGEDYSDLIGPKIFRTPLKAAYDDDDVVVVVKPQGVPVMGKI